MGRAAGDRRGDGGRGLHVGRGLQRRARPCVGDGDGLQLRFVFGAAVSTSTAAHLTNKFHIVRAHLLHLSGLISRAASVGSSLLIPYCRNYVEVYYLTKCYLIRSFFYDPKLAGSLLKKIVHLRLS